MIGSAWKVAFMLCLAGAEAVQTHDDEIAAIQSRVENHQVPINKRMAVQGTLWIRPTSQSAFIADPKSAQAVQNAIATHVAGHLVPNDIFVTMKKAPECVSFYVCNGESSTLVQVEFTIRVPQSMRPLGIWNVLATTYPNALKGLIQTQLDALGVQTVLASLQYKKLEKNTEHAFGDPHVTNVKGQRFDIQQTGMHALVQVPRGQGSKLNVQGRIEKVGLTCKMLYIRQLSMSGSMLSTDYEFTVNPSYVKPARTGRFFLRAGNFTTGDPMEFEKRMNPSEVAMDMQPKRETVLRKRQVTIVLQAGEALLNVHFNVNSGLKDKKLNGDHFDFEVSNLKTLASQDNIGGLMGIDDHSVAETKSCIEPHNLLETDDMEDNESSSILQATMFW